MISSLMKNAVRSLIDQVLHEEGTQKAHNWVSCEGKQKAHYHTDQFNEGNKKGPVGQYIRREKEGSRGQIFIEEDILSGLRK